MCNPCPTRAKTIETNPRQHWGSRKLRFCGHLSLPRLHSGGVAGFAGASRQIDLVEYRLSPPPHTRQHMPAEPQRRGDAATLSAKGTPRPMTILSEYARRYPRAGNIAEFLREDRGLGFKGLSIGPSGAICRWGRRIGQLFLTGSDIRDNITHMMLLFIT
jgi:hypothetical protein